jgi:amino acid adenylation domain-containing protein
MSSRTQLEIAQEKKKLLVDALLQAEPAEIYPASLAQQRLWFLDQLQGPTAAYNVHVGLWLYGQLNFEALQSSLQQVVNRHDSLRTSFRMEAGEIVQIVAQSYAVTLPVTDFSDRPEPYPPAYELAKQVVGKPFDLSTGPLFRAHLLRIAAEEHVLLCVMHHTVTDAWSMQLFAKEMALLYDAIWNGRPANLPELPIQYGDYSEWQHASFETGDVQRQVAFWKQTLQDAPPVLELPQDRPRPAEQTLSGFTSTFQVPAEIVARIRSVATKHQATPFMLLLAAFKVLLYRYSGQPDVLVGVPVAGRNRVETEGLIGFFVNTLASRDNLRGNPKFIDLLARVRESTLAAFAHADVPFEKVVEVLQPERNLSYNPVFQVMFSSIKSPVGSSDFGNLKVYSYVVDASTSIFDLNMTFVEWADGRCWTQIDYNTDLFDPATIQRMQQHFCNLLRGIAADPGQRIAELPLLTDVEEQQLLVDFNNTHADFRLDLCLHHFFEQQVSRTPDATAVICGQERISYQELNRRAAGLAAYLRRQSVGPDVLVGLCANRSLSLLVGILGILKAGGAYVPLDPAYPKERIECILEDSGLSLVLTENTLTENFLRSRVKPIALDRDWSTVDDDPALQATTTPQNLAYVLFTSGSTGRPKGVAIEHRNAANFIQWAQTVFTAEELAGTLFATSICFDLSIFEMFVPWSVGGAVIVAENAVSLPELPAAKEVTLINTVPSVMAELVRSAAVPDSVLTVNLAGEALPNSLVRDLYHQTHVRNVYNLYGPTEAATYATFTRIGPTEEITIGKPIANTQAYILDRDSKLVPRGGRGELYLAGEGLARGYFGRPDLTAERFVRNPFNPRPGSRLYRTGDLCRHRADGSIEYLGRLDHQIKLRGFRIELGEIEAVLQRDESVRQAVAMVRESDGEKRLAAYVTAKPDSKISVSALHQHLERSLPAYMVPDAFVVVDEFPRTVNGKIDRRALPPPEGPVKARGVAPRNELETTLAQIWEGVLPARPVGVTDNFFDLGGHSLLAARLIAQVQAVTGKKVPLSALFRAPTIESLARLLARHDCVLKPDPLLMELHQGSNSVPFFAIAAPGVDSFGLALLARHTGEEQSVYKLQGPGPLIWDRPLEKEELRGLAREYVAAMRSIQPHGPFCLGGMCEGVLIAQQMILELESQGEEVALFVIFDTWVLENSQIRPLWAIDYYLQRARAFPDLPLKEKLAIVRRTFKRWSKRNGSGGNRWPQVYWPGEGFQPPRFRAPVLLFKRPKQPFYYVRDPEMGWGSRSIGGVEICEVNCTHFEILRQPHVQFIGEKLAARLQAIAERVPDPPMRFPGAPPESDLESGFAHPA